MTVARRRVRYLAQWHRPGVGASAIMVFGFYTSDKRAFRFMPERLKADNLPAGQYRLIRDDEEPTAIGWLYKQATA